MATVKTAVSLDMDLFEQVEKLAAELEISRSRLFTLALEQLVELHENRALLESLNAAYDDRPDAEEEALLAGMRRKQRRLAED